MARCRLIRYLAASAILKTTGANSQMRTFAFLPCALSTKRQVLGPSGWLDGRFPGQLDVPVKGRFKDGVDSFYADDTQDGVAVKARFLWSGSGPDTRRWEQAFSADDGAIWETNWTTDFTRKPQVQQFIQADGCAAAQLLRQPSHVGHSLGAEWYFAYASCAQRMVSI